MQLLRPGTSFTTLKKETESFVTRHRLPLKISYIRSNLLISSTIRYFLLQYEDLALAPVATMKKVLKFIDVPFTAFFKQTLSSHTFVLETMSNNAMFGARKLSRNRALRWRPFLTFAEVQEIQNNCSDVINQMGMRLFDTEENYRNLSVPVWTGRRI